MASAVDRQYGSDVPSELTGDDKRGARRPDVSWDEEVVPTLRKRLESESAFLSKRLSNPKPTPPPPPPQHQPQWHRPTPSHSYRPSQDYQSSEPYSSPVRSPVVVSKIPVPASGSARSRGQRKASESNGSYSFPRSDDDEFGARFVGESSSGGDGDASETDGSLSRSRSGPRTRTKSTPFAFAAQPVTGSYATPPHHPPHMVTPPSQLLDLPPNRYKPRNSSPTDAPVLSSGSASSSPASNVSPKARTIALPYPPTRIPAPARSRSGSTSSSNKLAQTSGQPPLPRSMSGGSMSINGSPVLDEDDPWSETEVIRSDRMIRDEVAPFRILSPEIVVPGAGGRLELGKVDNFTERELLRQTQTTKVSPRREMLDIAQKGHSKAVSGGGSNGKVDEIELKDHDGGSRSHSPSQAPSGITPARRRVSSAAGINGRTPSQSSASHNTPDGRQSRKTSLAGAASPHDSPRTPRGSNAKSPNGMRNVSGSGSKPRAVTKSFSANVRSTTPDEEKEIGGYKLSSFGPDSIPPPSASKMKNKDWDQEIIPAARKNQKPPNPLDRWEEPVSPDNSPLKGKWRENGDGQPQQQQLPHQQPLGNGRPIFNEEPQDFDDSSRGDGDQPQRNQQTDGRQNGPKRQQSQSHRPPPLRSPNSINSMDQLRPPRSYSDRSNGNGQHPPHSPAPFSAYPHTNQQPGRADTPHPSRPARPSADQEQRQGGEKGKKEKSGGCCGCSIM